MQDKAIENLCSAIETNNELIKLSLPKLIDSINRLGISIKSLSNSIDKINIKADIKKN